MKKFVSLLALLSGAATAAEPAPGFNLILEGALPQAAQVQVDIRGDAGSFRQTLPLVGGRLLQGVASPEGKSSRLTLSAVDARGEKLFQGSLTLEGGAGFEYPATLQLKSALDGSLAEVRIASQRVAVEFATVEREGRRLTRASAQVFDADGALLPAKEGEFAWGFDLPGLELYPCPASEYRAPLCAEFLPIKKGMIVRLDVCFRERICRVDFVPVAPPMWRDVALNLANHACALKLDGRLYCWGEGQVGQLGFVAPKLCEPGGSAGSTFGCSPTAQPVQCAWGPCLFNDVSAGMKHTCAIDVNQDAWCWGNNTEGELGLATYNDRKDPGVPVPHAVVGGHKWLSIHAAFGSTCGLTTRHEVYCWGKNSPTLVPHLTAGWHNVPQRVNVPGPVAAMDVSFTHACAQTTGGELYCWGSNLQTELGALDYVTAPGCANCPTQPLRMQDRIASLANKVVRLVSTGSQGSCAHTTDDRTTCWGRATAAFNLIRPLDRLSRGFNHYCAVGSGQGICAGLGPLGDGNDNNSGIAMGPVLVGRPPTHFREIDAGNFATCGIGNDERVYCWGGSAFGRLGLGLNAGTVLRPTALVIP